MSAAIHLSSLTRSESYRNTDIDNNPENTALLLSPNPFHFFTMMHDVCQSHICSPRFVLTLRVFTPAIFQNTAPQVAASCLTILRLIHSVWSKGLQCGHLWTHFTRNLQHYHREETNTRGDSCKNMN